MALVITAAFILDCIIGDPQNPLHPMRLIGGGIAKGIKLYKKTGINKPVAQFMMGAALTLITAGTAYTLTKLLTWSIHQANCWAGLAVEAIISYFLIAPKALKTESMKVYRSVNDANIEEARKNLSYIVGRDTQNLTVPDIIKATVETISENLSDGVIAPLIYISIGGAPLGMAYKAINTLDSMIGYKNEEYQYFGKFAARLDDAVNLIPSRIAAMLMIPASAMTRNDAKAAVRIYKRDRKNHKSPNSAQTESVCAGALGLRLGGDSYYKGVLVKKTTIGDEKHPPSPNHIIAANRLMYATTITAVVIICIVLIIAKRL